MKWIDYREKLGIGFDNNDKIAILRNKAILFINYLYQNVGLNSKSFEKYLFMIGEINQANTFLAGYELSILSCTSIKEIISKCVALCNTFTPNTNSQNFSKKKIIEMVGLIINDLNISYDIYSDTDDYFIFPKGAKELDDLLVSEPLQWLEQYQLSHKAFIKALKEYSNYNGENASDIADKFRKALETFFQEFFGGNKSLENYKTEYGNFLKEKSIPAELSGNFQTLLTAYTNFNNGYAKHHDKTTQKVLEYIMYETGNIIRFLITLKEGQN